MLALVRPAALALAMFAAACAEAPDPAAEEALARQQAERVRRANAMPPPVSPVIPQPLLAEDIERHDLASQGCTYSPGTSLAPRLIAREADAFMKLDNEIVRLAADPGSRELPGATRSVYNGRELSLRLTARFDGAEGAAAIGEGEISVTDRWNRVVYEGAGRVTCAGSAP